MPEEEKIPISMFPDATTINGEDVVMGLHDNANFNFKMSGILAWLVNAVRFVFVPIGRTVNNKSLSSDITLTASDVGAQPTITVSGILKGDGAGGVSAATPGQDYQAPLTIDATPTENSTNPVQSGGVYTDVRTRVPNYGKGKNLLRNWYFVGGGTGRGVFPVNQRGQSSYSGATSVFDGWTADANTSITLGSTGITVSILSGSSTNIYQRAGKAPLGQSITMSILTGNGLVSVSGVMPSTLPSSNQTVLTVGTSAEGYRFRLYLQPAGTMYVEFRAYATQTWIAAKLELGTEQTLAHQENGTWVLNEIPDYEEELIKCQTSTADPSDTYANKSLATRQDLTNIQATGTTNTTGAAIPAGAYFYLNGILYRAKEQIGTNVPFTVNTNCEQVTEGGLNSFHCLSGELSMDITGVFMRFGSLVTVYLGTCQVAINGSSYTNMGNLPFACYQGINTNVYGNDREYVVDIAANSRALRIKWVGGAALPSGGKPSIRGIVQYITTE